MSAVHTPVELVFEGPSEPIPASIAPLRVTFRSGSDERVVSGFWDGGRRYLVRMLPEVAGKWTWQSSSDFGELDAQAGEFTVIGADGGHGVVRVADRFHFAHADGTPFRPVGATVYNWLHQEESLFDVTVGAVASAGFNKLRFMVFPQAGGYVEHHPTQLPFAKSDGQWDPDRPDIDFFRRLDRAVQILGERGIEADVLIYNAYDGGRFGLDGLSEQQDAVYLRYLVARLSAYPNVWWSLCNEFDLIDRPRDRWNRAGELLAEIDPHGHLRSIHNWMELPDHNQPWITHASIQNGHVTTDFGRAGLYRDVYGKPIVLDEIKYEGDVPERWGHLSARELVDQFWIATVSGCYASHGESFAIDSGSLHIVEGGEFRGESPARLGFLRQFLDSLRVPGLNPIDKWDDPEYVAGAPRRQYVRYFGRSAPGSWAFRLPQASEIGEQLQVGDRFEVEVIDTWNMTVTPLGRIFELNDVQRNNAYAPGVIPLPEGEAIALQITRVLA